MSTANGNHDNDNGNRKKSLPQLGADSPVAKLGAIDGLPASEKVYIEAGTGTDTVRVPMRRILQSNGETFDVYDTSGPHGIDPNIGCRSCAKPGSTHAWRPVSTPAIARKCTMPAAA